MEHVWTVACRQSIIDSESNNISLISAVERIAFGADGTVQGVPFQMEVVSTWWRSDLNTAERSRGRILLYSPSGEVLDDHTHTFEIDLTTYSRLRVRGQYGGLPFVGNGVYKFEVQLEVDGQWNTVASVPIQIIREPSDTEPASTA